MDVLAQAQLQRFLLAERSLPYLMISHDRELLNSCCNRTVFLRDRQLHAFDLPFGAAAQALAEQDEQAAHLRDVEEKEIRRLQHSAKRLARWGRDHDNENLARKAKTMQRRVEGLKMQQTVLSEGSALDVQLQTDAVRAKSMLNIEKLSVSTPDGKRKLLDIEFQYVRPGDRIASLGRNGVGKSSTIECLMGALHGGDGPSGVFQHDIHHQPCGHCLQGVVYRIDADSVGQRKGGLGDEQHLAGHRSAAAFRLELIDTDIEFGQYSPDIAHDARMIETGQFQRQGLAGSLG